MEVKNRIRLFLVDDQKELINSISLFVQKMPLFEIVGEANSGYGCLKLIKQQPVDILIMDINMESLDAGFLTAEKLLQSPGSMKIIFLTAYPNKKNITKAQNMNCSFIDKAFSISTILKSVEIIFKEKKAILLLTS